MDTSENQIKMTDGNHKRKTSQCLLEGIEFTFRNEDTSKSPKLGWRVFTSDRELMSHSCLVKVSKFNVCFQAHLEPKVSIPFPRVPVL